MFASIRSGCFFAATAIAAATGTTALGDTTPAAHLKSQPADMTAITPTAEVVLSRVLYQRQRALACAGLECAADFATLTAKQRIELQHVTCVFSFTTAAGTVVAAFAQYTSAPGNTLQMPLALGSEASLGGTTTVTYHQATSMYVPPKNTLRTVIVQKAVSPVGSCQIFGQFVTLK